MEDSEPLCSKDGHGCKPAASDSDVLNSWKSPAPPPPPPPSPPPPPPPPPPPLEQVAQAAGTLASDSGPSERTQGLFAYSAYDTDGALQKLGDLAGKATIVVNVVRAALATSGASRPFR